MTDNVTLPATGAPVATDDIGGFHWQRVKLGWGPDGTANEVDEATGKPFPMQVRSATGLVPLGEPTDAKSTATDGTSVSAISIWKQISASIQTLAGAVSASKTAVTVADGDAATLGAKADAKSTATDTTAISAMSVWKQISSSAQAIATLIAGTLTVATHAVTQSGTWTVEPGNTANTTAWKVDGSAVTQPVSLASVPSHAVTNAGTFAVQASEADGANVTLGAKADAKSTATDTTAVSAISIWKQISASVQLMVFGAGTAAAAQRTTLASDDPAVATLGSISGAKVVTDSNGTLQQYLRGIVTQGIDVSAGEYEAVSASATNQALGATGAAGDYLEAVLIVPATTSPGAVTIKDGSNSAITIFAGGSTSLSDLAPIYTPLAIKSTNGAWQITTGTNVSAIGIGNFT